MRNEETHLVTKFVTTILELVGGNLAGIIDQDWQARSLGLHPLVNILLQTVAKPIRNSAQCPNPHFLAQPIPDIVNRIFQTTLPMGIRLEMPCLREANGEGRGQGHCVVW